MMAFVDILALVDRFDGNFPLVSPLLYCSIYDSKNYKLYSSEYRLQLEKF